MVAVLIVMNVRIINIYKCSAIFYASSLLSEAVRVVFRGIYSGYFVEQAGKVNLT
jgi:hypothetical protein